MGAIRGAVDQVESFQGKPGRHPLVLRSSGDAGDNSALIAFHRSLGMELAKRALKPKKQLGFHVTMLRGEQMEGAERVDPVCWVVREFVLVRSLVGLTVHEHLARWTLQG